MSIPSADPPFARRIDAGPAADGPVTGVHLQQELQRIVPVPVPLRHPRDRASAEFAQQKESVLSEFGERGGAASDPMGALLHAAAPEVLLSTL